MVHFWKTLHYFFVHHWLAFSLAMFGILICIIIFCNTRPEEIDE